MQTDEGAGKAPDPEGAQSASKPPVAQQVKAPARKDPRKGDHKGDGSGRPPLAQIAQDREQRQTTKQEG